MRQCWGTDAEQFSTPEQMGDLMKLVRGDLKRLARRGIEIVGVRSSIVCTRALNDAADAGVNRFVVDLHTMERLIIELSEAAESEVDAVCGKVGGFSQYSKAFGPLGGRLHVVLEEGRARSSYRFPGLGDIAFVRDSDDSNMLVGMASLVGKYVRDLLMDRIIDHYRTMDPSLPRASGYHDPVSNQFVLGTAALRKKRRIPKTCFERHKVGG